MDVAQNYLSCACTHCAGVVEYPPAAAGARVQCPHCGRATLLRRARRPYYRKRMALPLAFAGLGAGLFLLLLSGAETRSFKVENVKLTPGPAHQDGEVTGVVRNTSSRARHSVRVEIDLYDRTGVRLWQATDFAAELAPRADWQFRAAVPDRAVVTARVASVRER